MKAELIFFLERFPDFKEQIKLLFETDEEFQALCLDYFLCIRSLEQWELAMKRYQERLEGYVELKKVLETRLLQQVAQRKKSEIDSLDSDAPRLDNSDSNIR